MVEFGSYKDLKSLKSQQFSFSCPNQPCTLDLTLFESGNFATPWLETQEILKG